ncbi:unnamed protein product [Prunus armeniaca]
MVFLAQHEWHVAWEQNQHEFSIKREIRLGKEEKERQSSSGSCQKNKLEKKMNSALGIWGLNILLSRSCAVGASTLGQHFLVLWASLAWNLLPTALLDESANLLLHVFSVLQKS